MKWLITKTQLRRINSSNWIPKWTNKWQIPDSHNPGCNFVAAETRHAKASIKDWCLSKSRIQEPNSSPFIIKVMNVPRFVTKPYNKTNETNH